MTSTLDSLKGKAEEGGVLDGLKAGFEELDALLAKCASLDPQASGNE